MDHVVFWIFLWLIPTLSLSKLKLCIGFFCLALIGIVTYFLVNATVTEFSELLARFIR
jgi:hypothetical protein